MNAAPSSTIGQEPARLVRPRPLGRAILWLLELYRSGVSPLRPACCRFTPTCSAYAVEAITIHGAGRGSWLAVRRLLRCHPLHAGGHDPVPPRVDATSRPTTPRATAEPAA